MKVVHQWVHEAVILTTGIPNSQFEEIDQILMIYVMRIEWDVIAWSARCYVTQWAVENLSALQGIVWN